MKCPTSSAFYFLTKALLTLCDHNFCNLTHDSKTSMDLFFLLHNFMDGRFILTIDLSNLSKWFFSFFITPRTFTFLLKGSTLWLLVGISELPASVLLKVGPLWSKKGWLEHRLCASAEWIWCPRWSGRDERVGRQVDTLNSERCTSQRAPCEISPCYSEQLTIYH